MSVALGVKVFKRTEKLRRLLESVDPDVIETVYVADDGRTADRRELYDREWPFELTLIDLEYDAGLGYGRERILDELTERYLLIVDSDHTVPNNVDLLRRQLEARPSFGGISGLLLEYGHLGGMCHDLRERDGVLIRSVDGDKQTLTVAGHPVVPFDFVPNVALFRRSCLEDRSWDPNYVIAMEHLDFYVTHWAETDWRFGVSPAVQFGHDPRSDRSYERDRGDETKRMASKRYFLNKWGYRQVVLRNTWLRERHNTPTARLPFTPPLWLEATLFDLNDAYRRRKGVLKNVPSVFADDR